MASVLDSILQMRASGKKMLGVLIDPDKFDVAQAGEFFLKLPDSTTHILVGGSSVKVGENQRVLGCIKEYSKLPVILFPGDASQISDEADALLFLSLISGRNPEYLIGQQLKAVPALQFSRLEVIPTGYLLIDGGKETAVQRVSQTYPMSQQDIPAIVHTALAGQFLGKQLIYLEAGSGAAFPVSPEVISEVRKAVSLPLLVGGGIRTEIQIQAAFDAGADMVVIGTAIEKGEFVQNSSALVPKS